MTFAILDPSRTSTIKRVVASLSIFLAYYSYSPPQTTAANYIIFVALVNLIVKLVSSKKSIS